MAKRVITIIVVAVALIASTTSNAQSYCETEVHLWTIDMEPLMADYAHQTYMSHLSGSEMEQIFNATTLAISSVMSLSLLECDDTIERVGQYQLLAHYVLLNATIHSQYGMEDAIRDASATTLLDLERLIRDAYNGLED